MTGRDSELLAAAIRSIKPAEIRPDRLPDAVLAYLRAAMPLLALENAVDYGMADVFDHVGAILRIDGSAWSRAAEAIRTLADIVA